MNFQFDHIQTVVYLLELGLFCLETTQNCARQFNLTLDLGQAIGNVRSELKIFRAKLEEINNV
jgi:hypothetical protein